MESEVPPLGELIPLRDLYRTIRSARNQGQQLHGSGITRHIKRGLLGPDGQRHRLRAWKFAGAWYTTADQFSEFIRATTGTRPGEGLSPRTFTRRNREAERAGEQLAASGA